MLKRIIALALAAMLLLSACGRGESPASESVTDSAPQSAPASTAEDTLAYLREHLPVMDGSTSLIPLEAGLRAAIFGKTYEEATADVAHSSTWDSFYNLLNNNAELIFSCPLSEQQRKTAAEQGVELEETPVAMEGFVFVVNAKNPVDTLTQAQLRDIYSGKITNWKQVGGSDAEIIAYQRNNNSGSQNYMIDFMGDTPLLPAPTELRPGSMSGLMDVIAVNHNAENAIGYSVYAYAADMYGSGDDIKFIKVDGVAPDKNTMAAGSYPLLGYNYAIFRADAPQDGSVRRMVDYITSYDGQLAIAKAGYVTLENIGFDYEAHRLEKYQATGTGGKAPASLPSYEYTVGYNLPMIHSALADGTPSYRLDILTNAALQDEINAYIDEQVAKMAQDYDAFAKYIERLNSGGEYERFTIAVGSPYLSYGNEEKLPPADVTITAKNGYLSVAVSHKYIYQVQDGYDRFYSTQTATWDLLTGKRLAPEELFYDGVDIDEALNAYITEKYQQPIDSWHTYYEMKSDFAGLTLSGWHLAHDAIYIDYQNPYFGNGARMLLSDLPEGLMVCEQARDMTDCFVGSEYVRKFFRITERNKVYKYIDGTDLGEHILACSFLAEDSYPAAAKINSAVESYIKAHYTYDTISAYYKTEGVPEDQLDLYWLDWYMTEYGGRFVSFSGSRPRVWNGDGSISHAYPYKAALLFDLQTGAELSWRDILANGWQEHYRFEGENNEDISGIDFDKLDFSWFRANESGEIYFILEHIENGRLYSLYLPPEYIKW